VPMALALTPTAIIRHVLTTLTAKMANACPTFCPAPTLSSNSPLSPAPTQGPTIRLALPTILPASQIHSTVEYVRMAHE
jgi:hypothetical protein